MKRKQFSHTEELDLQYQTITEINQSEFAKDLMKINKEISRSSAALKINKAKGIENEESKNLKTMKPPKSPSINNYALP